MSILNPCCCITLRAGSRAIAILDIIVALILLLIFLSDLTLTISQNGKPELQVLSSPSSASSLTNSESDTSCEDEEGEIKQHMSVGSIASSYVTSGVWIIMSVFLCTNVGISALLYTGAKNYRIKRCKWWFYIQTLITTVALLVLILIICFQVPFELLVLDLIHLLYRLYSLWVVYLFIGELTYLDTLCSLNNNKKPPGVTIYAPHQSIIRPATFSGTPIAAPPRPYQQDPYTFTNEEWPVQTGSSVTATGAAHYSSDDGFPSSRSQGIDNPTYLP